jgi:hypothetical protein
VTEGRKDMAEVIGPRSTLPGVVHRLPKGLCAINTPTVWPWCACKARLTPSGQS